MADGVPPLDAGQREAVTCMENAVVSAGAGSGKTTVLAERYLRIVKEGRATVEEILTLTYTRKAAAEMYERIYRRLREEGDDPRIKDQIAQFDRSQISTLDSFCVQVVRNSPQYFGVPSDFVLGEEQSMRSDEETALAYLLDNSDDPALLSFIRLNGFESVWKDFFVSLGSDYFHLARRRDFKASYRKQIEALERITGETATRLAGVGEQIRGIDSGSIKAIADARERISAVGELGPLLEEARYEEAGSLLEALKLNRRTGSGSSPAIVHYKELADEFDRLKEQLVRAVFTLASRETLRRLFEMCDEYQEILLRRKRRTGALSFRDVVEMAVRLLTDNRELRRYYKRRFRYLMIDEFQDNNELQKQLLYLLAEKADRESPDAPGPDDVEPDKLFFVGDEKQSIYRFRGADVAVFRGLSDELRTAGGRPISLATNYRSAPLLIDFYNRFFSEIFSDPSEDFEARFSPLSAGLGWAGTGSSDPATIRLFYKPYGGPPEAGEAHSDDAEAYYIARFIKESVDARSLLFRDGDCSRPADWNDFALLMRTTSNQIRYEKIFRRLNIPYTTQSVRTLFLEAPLNDLYAALELVVHPDDRTAYAALLRSPFVNLSDSAVVEILLEGAAPFEELPSSIEAGASDGERFMAGRGLYRYLAQMADFVPIARLVDDLWYRFGYRYHILRDASSHPYLEYYDYFRKLASDADRDGSSLSEFLDLIRPNLGKYEKLPELEVVRDQARGVQLLTIHKAKGLEFPIVILANSGNLGRSRREEKRPYYLSDEFGLTLRVTDRGNYFYSIAEEEARRKENAELKRLLYVALTRAKSHLVISGCHNRQNRTADGALLNMILGILTPGEASEENLRIRADFADVRVHTIPPVTEAELLTRRTPVASDRLESLLQAYRRAEIVEWKAGKRNWTASEISETVWRLVWEPSPRVGLFPEGYSNPERLPSLRCDPLIEAGEVETAFGILAHTVIERRLAGMAMPSERDLPAPLRRALTRELLEPLLAEARVLAEGFLDSEIGRRAGRAAKRMTERMFILRPCPGYTVRGAFDLVFEDEEGVCVIDFKTDRELQPAAYGPQLHAYRLAAAELLHGPLTASLFYLRGGRSVTVDDRLLLPLYRRFFDLHPRGPNPDGVSWEGDGAALFAELLGALSFVEEGTLDRPEGVWGPPSTE